MGQCDNTLTASKMQASQYDSITLDRGGYAECWFLPHCYEYIIYDPKRVVSMKGYPYNGWNSWFPAPKWPGWPGMQLYNSAKTSEAARPALRATQHARDSDVVAAGAGLDALLTQVNGISTSQEAQEVQEVGLQPEASVGGRI